MRPAFHNASELRAVCRRFRLPGASAPVKGVFRSYVHAVDDQEKALRGLTSRQRALWAAVTSTSDVLDTATLAARAGLDSSEARDSLRALVRKGLIRLERQAGGGAELVRMSEPDDVPWPRPGARAPRPPGHEEGFRQLEGDHGLLLVVPRATKRGWREEERPWRSLVIDPQRRIVSAGFPKFFAWGEHSGDTDRARRALVRGQFSWVSEKLDGSLVIRSVHRGRVILRTRGTHDGGALMADDLRAHVGAHHPGLLDPDLEPSISLLFEFRHPDHPVVLAIGTPSLVLIGAVDHGWPPRLAQQSQLDALAARHGLVRVAEVEGLPKEPKLLRRAVADWEGREGVVLRAGADQVLVKLKSRDYRERQKARLSLSPERLMEIAGEHGVEREDDLVPALIDEGYPAEMADTMRPMWRHLRLGAR